MRYPASTARRLVRRIVALLIGLALLAPSGALASGDDVWIDCGDADGTINHTHSQADYTDALKNPPADAAEYSSCLDLIRQAQLRDSQKSASSDTASRASSGSTVAPAALTAALRRSGVDPGKLAEASSEHRSATVAAPAPVVVGGEQIDLAAARVPSIASALSLPLPLAAAAIVVLLSAGLPLVRYVAARFGGSPAGPPSTP
ncbi:MAG: hypothetical protein QM679_07030 [Patulibacter sp.]